MIEKAYESVEKHEQQQALSSLEPETEPVPTYSAESALDFMKVALAGGLCFAGFGYLHTNAAGPAHWWLLLAPSIGSIWFGAMGRRLPVAKYLIAGIATGIAGVVWLAWPDWLRLAMPSHPLLMLGVLAIGSCSYLLGAMIGALWSPKASIGNERRHS